MGRGRDPFDDTYNREAREEQNRYRQDKKDDIESNPSITPIEVVQKCIKDCSAADMKIIKQYGGMIEDHFFSEDELVWASSTKEAELLFAHNLRKKIIAMKTDQEMLDYFQILAAVKD
jgi:hypothetical protein